MEAAGWRMEVKLDKAAHHPRLLSHNLRVSSCAASPHMAIPQHNPAWQFCKAIPHMAIPQHNPAWRFCMAIPHMAIPQHNPAWRFRKAIPHTLPPFGSMAIPHGDHPPSVWQVLAQAAKACLVETNGELGVIEDEVLDKYRELSATCIQAVQGQRSGGAMTDYIVYMWALEVGLDMVLAGLPPQHPIAVAALELATPRWCTLTATFHHLEPRAQVRVALSLGAILRGEEWREYGEVFPILTASLSPTSPSTSARVAAVVAKLTAGITKDVAVRTVSLGLDNFILPPSTLRNASLMDEFLPDEDDDEEVCNDFSVVHVAQKELFFDLKMCASPTALVSPTASFPHPQPPSLAP